MTPAAPAGAPPPPPPPPEGRNPMRRSPCRRLLLAVAASATLALGAAAAPASADEIGGQLYATGGTIELDVRAPVARLDSDLFLLAPDGTRGATIATNRDAGKHVTLGPFPAGQELVFGIDVPEIGATFLMGPGDRNPDGLAHARVVAVGERTFDVGFEDRLGGGDLDYDDNSFRFTGNLSPNEPPMARDDGAVTDEDRAVDIAVLGNDDDPEGGALVAALGDGPAHGSATCDGGGCRYVPAAHFTGADSFTYTACDPDGACATATVTVTVRGTGRLTGGGVTRSAAGPVRHRAALGCTAAQGGRLRVRGAAGRFVLGHVDRALCVDDPDVASTAAAGWDTHRGSGTGTLGGVPGYSVEWALTDAGPGGADTADIVVRDPSGSAVLTVAGPLRRGDQRAHAG